jgi:hypothetical protein
MNPSLLRVTLADPLFRGQEAEAKTQSKGMIRDTFAWEAFPRQPQLVRVQEISSFAHIFIASVSESDDLEHLR